MTPLTRDTRDGRTRSEGLLTPPHEAEELSSSSAFGEDTLFKVLNDDGISPYAGYKWPLPNGKPGDWVHADGNLIPCQFGIHYCKAEHLVSWLGPTIYVFETHPDAQILHADNKSLTTCGRLIRRIEAWNKKTARLFAANCAERVLPIWERQYPRDNRPANAIKAARAFARGEISGRDLAAAREAAWAAEAASAAGAARAAWAAWAAGAAEAAEAAWAAGAARASERKWQAQRLFEYLNGEVAM